MEYTIQNNLLTVTVSDHGAELKSVKDREGTEYLWQADPAFWDETAPNLFPYVGRMTQGTCTVNGKEYRMKIHGFLKYMTLSAEEQSRDSITFRLTDNAGTRSQYPFSFTYRITYAISGSLLSIKSRVENRGQEREYFGLGGHPGFRVPLEDGLSFEDYEVVFDAPAHPSRVGFSDTCFLTGKDEPYPLADDRRIPLRHSLFDEDALVLKHVPRKVRLLSKKGKKSVTVTFPDYPYIGFWHKPHSEAPYVCIEPWSSLPSRDGIVEELSQQADLIGLDGGKTYENQWSIRFETNLG